MAKKRQSVEERMRDLDALDTVGGVAVMDESIAPPPRVRANTDYIDLDPRDIEIIDPVIGNVRFQLDDDEDDIEALAASIQKSPSGEGGPLQAIAVRNIGTPVEPRWALVWGTRRLRAVLKLGLPTITVRNLGIISDTEAAFYQAVENLQRKDLNAIEKALSFKRYLDEHRCTQEDLAKRLKIDRSTIANLIRLLELPQDVMDCLRNDQLSAGHARALLPLGDEQLQREFCRRILAEGWSVRDTERLVQERILHEDGAPEPSSPLKRKRTKSDQLLSLEQQLRVVLGTKVEIKQTSTGRGRFVIHFANHEEFERLWEAMTDQRSESQRHSA